MGNNIFHNESERDLYLLPTRLGSVGVIISNVKFEKPRVPGRDEAFYQQFDSINTGGVGEGDSGIV